MSGGDLAGHDDQASRDQRLASDARLGILRQNRVEDSVGDLVGDLVGMSLGNQFRGEEELAGRHDGPQATRSGYWMCKKKEIWNSWERLTAYSTAERSGFRFRSTLGGICTLPSRRSAGIVLWMSM